MRLDLGARDAGGDFTLRLGPTPGSIEAWPTGLRQQKLTAGCNDLGDFQLRPAPIVVSGRALIEDAPAVLDVPLMTRIENGGRWRVATELRATWLADGRFVIRGNVAADTRLQLLVKDGPYRTLGALDCVAGATDLEVRLRAVPERGAPLRR